MVMRRGLHAFVLLSGKNEGSDPHMLDHARDKARRNPCQDCSEQNSPDHVVKAGGLVAGKASGVARVVSGVVQARILRKTCAENHERAKEQRRHADGNALRNGKSTALNCGGHVTLRATRYSVGRSPVRCPAGLLTRGSGGSGVFPVPEHQ